MNLSIQKVLLKPAVFILFFEMKIADMTLRKRPMKVISQANKPIYINTVEIG